MDEAKANGTYLKAPNGKASNLNERQWVQVRTKAFKDWFGDWELAAKVVKIISANVEHGFKNFAEARKWAKGNLLGTYINPEIGEIVVSGKAIDKYLSSKAVEQSHSRDAHWSALQVLPRLIENSIVGEIHEDRDKNSNIKDIVRLFGAMNIGNETSRVKITVKRYSDNNTPNKAYTYEVTEIEPLDGHWTTHTQNADFVPTSNDSITGAKLLKGIENSKGLPILNSSKVVDENGEPKVVYHQTNKTIYRNVENGKLWDDLDWQEKQEWEERDDWEDYWEEEDFYEFSRTNARTTNEFDGFFFAPKYDEYHEYGDRTIEAFLNIRKPASQDDYYIDAQYNDAGKKERIRLQEEGFDGVIRMEGNEVWEYVAFDPTQIKSATDNVGTFDASNPDIRYSLASEQVESVLEDYTLNKDNALDFEYALMQSIAGQSHSANPSYKMLDGVEIRVKDHTPDWDNFVDWETDKVKSEKILNVTVGDYEDTDYRRSKEDYESFVEAHPETTAVNVDIEDGTSLADALSQIHEALKEKGIDFEFAPDYSWTKWSEYSTAEQSDSEMRYSLIQPTDEKATFDNFFENSTAIYTILPNNKRPKGKPNFESNSGSEYWYGEDEGGKYVIRESDHWSTEISNNAQTKSFNDKPDAFGNIASCFWAIDIRGLKREQYAPYSTEGVKQVSYNIVLNKS